MDNYPLPSYAVSMWIAGDNLMVTFPPTRGERGHTITLPASTAGLKTALTIMQDRQNATDLRIGNKGTPAQWEIENDQRYRALMEARKADKAASAAEKAEAIAFLAELGL